MRAGLSGFAKLGVISLVLILSGCVSKYRVDAYTPPAAHIEKEASFYVPLPQNGQFDGTEYPNSGSQTAAELRAALLVHVSKVEVGTTKAEDLTAALAEAKKRGLDHLAQADILHWEDRATEWSGIPDKITLKLSIYDVQSGALLSSTVTAASSKWGTLGGDHPQDLLPEPIKRFVDPLF